MRLIRLLKNDLAREVRAWVESDIISKQQAEKICASYGMDFNDQSQRSYAYFVLIGLGYLFMGLSVLTLVGANWEDIPRGVRMSGLIALTLFTSLGGVYRWYQEKQGLAIVLFFLGGLFYGASIMLIAQIYHLGEHYPDGILWWAIGVLPLALLTQSILLMLLTTTLAYIWFFVETSLQFYPFVFPIFLLAITWVLWGGKKSLLLFLALIAGIGLWSEYTLSWFISDRPGFLPAAENVVFIFGYFILLHGLAKWLTVQSSHLLADYGTVLTLWVMRFTLLMLFIFSFEGSWDALLDASWNYPTQIFILHLALCATAIFLALRSGRSMLSTLLSSVLTTILIAVVIYANIDDSAAEAFQVLDNIVLVVTGIWLIIRGIQSSISHYFYAGVLTIMLTGLLRYIDLIGDYIGAAVLFIVFALILLSAARYWKSHSSKAGVAE